MSAGRRRQAIAMLRGVASGLLPVVTGLAIGGLISIDINQGIAIMQNDAKLAQQDRQIAIQQHTIDILERTVALLRKQQQQEQKEQQRVTITPTR